MTPERFGEVDRIANLALDQSVEDRAEFVNRACAGDPELRRAVDSLLHSEEELGDFLADPPSKLAEDLVTKGPLVPGARLGRYVIKEHLAVAEWGLSTPPMILSWTAGSPSS